MASSKEYVRVTIVKKTKEKLRGRGKGVGFYFNICNFSWESKVIAFFGIF